MDLLQKDILEETEGNENEGSISDLPEKVDLVDLIDQPAWKTILIELVKKEKMNPWEIDISELVGKYLEKIKAISENNLKIPANAILACALLLKFKSNFLRVSQIDEKELEEEKRKMTPEELKEFEAMLPDLKNIRKIREGKVSLDELVNAIENMMRNSKKMAENSQFKRTRTKFVFPDMNFKIDMAMEKVFKKIQRNADSRGMVTFTRLTKDKQDNVSIVRTFICCLFLMNKGKILMWQEKFFDEIFISLKTDQENDTTNQPTQTSPA
jgi:segregation and condensation protein A